MRYHTVDPAYRANHMATHRANKAYKKYGHEIDYIRLWLEFYYAILRELHWH
jgi:hypothetical protein